MPGSFTLGGCCGVLGGLERKRHDDRQIGGDQTGIDQQVGCKRYPDGARGTVVTASAVISTPLTSQG
jgi:hypothetical protein